LTVVGHTRFRDRREKVEGRRHRGRGQKKGMSCVAAGEEGKELIAHNS